VGDTDTTAKLLASSSPYSGWWLSALPLANLGLHPTYREIHVAVKMRLGTTLSLERVCVSGVKVINSGLHGLSCRKGSGRLSRHLAINDIIARAFRSANVPAALKLLGLMRGDGKCPDGVNLLPWSRGDV